MHKLTEEQKKLLQTVVDHFENEDRDVRDRQIRTYRRLKLMWEGFQKIWYSEVAHDWRIWDEQQEYDQTAQDFYDKPINVFRAYLESIIAALSIIVPPVKCYPDDADNPLDIATAKAGDKIAKLIARHNKVNLLWLQALYIYGTEGMVGCYNYTDEDEKYGTYEVPQEKEVEEEREVQSCPVCGSVIDPDEYDPSAEYGEEELTPEMIMSSNQIICPECKEQIDPITGMEKFKVTRIVGKIQKPKARQCMEVYGGLYIKVANYAKKQADTPYLGFSYETNFAFARDRYPDIRDKIGPGMGTGGSEPYARWGRTNLQYQGTYPLDSVTCRNYWIRPAGFEILEDKEEAKQLKKLFPNGCKVVFIEQEFAEACDESLDDHWTLTYNPMADYLTHDPIGLLLTSVQEITNDIVSLTLQTIEHGIPQTFADPQVLNFKAYSQMETVPGGIYPATPKSGKSVKEGFYEVKTSALSGEVLPFFQQVQQLGQLVSGALPSLFGGQMAGGSGTASEYSMSRAQALQRLQGTWKMFTAWWEEINGKTIPAYIKTVQEDQRFVEKTDDGGFINVMIRKAELEGKIGNIEIEANENLPLTWNQRRDVIKELMSGQNPEFLAMLMVPENLPLIYEALGVDDFYVPGEDDRNKQYDEIKQLLNSEPLIEPPGPEQMMQAEIDMTEPMPVELPSVDVDPIMDNHAIEFEVCRKWAISEAGQQAKVDNPNGYKNVLLHAMQHQQLIPPPPMVEGDAPNEGQKQDTKSPIKGESDVKTSA